MIADISLLTALLAGLLSFLSPCVLPLVPPYLCFLAGASVEELAEEGERGARRDIILVSLLFIAGFSTVFVALGATASMVAQVLSAYRQTLATVAGLAIMVMGFHFLGFIRIGAMFREKRIDVGRPPGPLGAYLMGLAFAFGWTPCIGPILAAILAVAGSQDTVAKGAFLLGVYSLGLGIPFLAAAFAMGPFLRFLTRFRQHLGKIEKVAGALLVLTGIAFLTGGIETAAFWLLETFPVLGRLG